MGHMFAGWKRVLLGIGVLFIIGIFIIINMTCLVN